MPGRKLVEINSNYVTDITLYRGGISANDTSLSDIPIFTIPSDTMGCEHTLFILFDITGITFDANLYFVWNNKFFNVSNKTGVSSNTIWTLTNLRSGDYIISITNISGTGSVSIYHSFTN